MIMKKLLYIFILLPLFAIGQTVEDWEFQPAVTDNNMSVVFPAGTLSDFIGGDLMAFQSDGSPVGYSYHSVYEDGYADIAVIGTDNNCDCNQAQIGDELSFAILMNSETIVVVIIDPPITYCANCFEMVGYSSFITSFTVDGYEVEFGCTDDVYLEFNASANLDDGSCAGSVALI